MIYLLIRLVRIYGYQRKGRPQHACLKVEHVHIFHVALQRERKTLKFISSESGSVAFCLWHEDREGPSEIAEKNVSRCKSLYRHLTLAGTLLKVCKPQLMKATDLSSDLPLKWLCNSTLSASSLYHELFCINLERFLAGVGGISFILLTVLSACCLWAVA